MAPRLRPATDADWSAMFGIPPPGIWSGMVAATDHVIYGLGGIYASEDGSWWITFSRWPGVRYRKLAHKAARIILDAAREAGIAVHAIADPAIEGSELWIKRLGFKETDETRGGLAVWVLR